MCQKLWLSVQVSSSCRILNRRQLIIDTVYNMKQEPETTNNHTDCRDHIKLASSRSGSAIVSLHRSCTVLRDCFICHYFAVFRVAAFRLQRPTRRTVHVATCVLLQQLLLLLSKENCNCIKTPTAVGLETVKNEYSLRNFVNARNVCRGLIYASRTESYDVRNE